MTKKYKELSRDMISLGTHIPFDVLIYLSDEKSPKILNKDTVVSISDIERIQEFPEGHLIILKEDYEKFINNGTIKQS